MRLEDLGADTCRRIAIGSALPDCWSTWGWRKFQPDQFRSSFRRHDPRQIAGIGKEEEDTFNRSRHPLLELNPMRHGRRFNYMASGRERRRGSAVLWSFPPARNVFTPIFFHRICTAGQLFRPEGQSGNCRRTKSLNPTACGHLVSYPQYLALSKSELTSD
jgi:hypothetical protein